MKTDEKSGWLAPAELGEDAPHYINFAVPVLPQIGLFDTYSCELASTGQLGKDLISTYTMVRISKQALLLEVKKVELWFTLLPTGKNRGALRYIGKLSHADFEYSLMEIEPEEPSRLDMLCEKHHLFVVGCDPFTHYSGITKLSGLDKEKRK